MPDQTAAQWTVSVSQETDASVRTFLARQGVAEGNLSEFVEEAVKWRVLDRTMAEARGKFADLTPEALEALLNEAVGSTRHPDPA